MEQVNLVALLKGEDQKSQWRYVELRIKELLSNGYTARIIIDVQKHRINSIQDQAIISGLSQTAFYTGKID